MLEIRLEIIFFFFSFGGVAGASGSIRYSARSNGNTEKRARSCQLDRDSVRTDVDGALSDHGAVGLVDDAINLLEIVRVGDDLVVGDEVLFKFAGSEPFFSRGSKYRESVERNKP